MIQQTRAKIFLANERGCNENAYMRSYSTFNFGQFTSEHKQPFGSLTVWNDDTLAPGHSIQMHISENSYILYLPLVGAITCKDAKDNQIIIAAGEVYISAIRSGAVVEVSNHLEEALVNFLHIRVTVNDAFNGEDSAILRFDINRYRNQWSLMNTVFGKTLIERLPFYMGIAKFDGRSEIEYAVSERGRGVFVFVVNGAFEVQNRLLHERDGLALWDVDIVEAEALSNDAVVMIFEIPL